MKSEPKCLKRWRKQCADLRQQYQDAVKNNDTQRAARLSKQMANYAEVSKRLLSTGASRGAWQA